MKKLISFVCVVGVAASACAGGAIKVYFSPNGGCTEAVVSALNHATASVLAQAYSFTSAPIARALVDAERRDVMVKIILDKSQRTEHYSEADFTAHTHRVSIAYRSCASRNSNTSIFTSTCVGGIQPARQGLRTRVKNLSIIRSSVANGVPLSW